MTLWTCHLCKGVYTTSCTVTTHPFFLPTATRRQQTRQSLALPCPRAAQNICQIKFRCPPKHPLCQARVRIECWGIAQAARRKLVRNLSTSDFLDCGEQGTNRSTPARSQV